nr:MAG TPA: hypothetical protein [Caudoviricetes sp.]
MMFIYPHILLVIGDSLLNYYLFWCLILITNKYTIGEYYDFKYNSKKI